MMSMPEVHKMVILSVQLPTAANGEEDMEQLKPFMSFMLHLADRLSRFKLSKEVTFY